MKDYKKEALKDELVSLVLLLAIATAILGITFIATSCDSYQASPYVEGSYGEVDGLGVNDAGDRLTTNGYPGWRLTMGVQLLPDERYDAAQFERMLAAWREKPDPLPYVPPVTKPVPSKPETGTIGEIGGAIKDFDGADPLTKLIVTLAIVGALAGVFFLLLNLVPKWLKKDKKDD